MATYIRVAATTKLIDVTRPNLPLFAFPGEIYRVTGTYNHKGKELPMITKEDNDSMSRRDYIIADDSALMILHEKEDIGFHHLMDTVVVSQTTIFRSKVFSKF